MEGNTLMEEIKQAVLMLLRAGVNITAIQQSLIRVSDELKSAGVYMQAIKDSDKAP
jgi:ribosome-binding factor A